jgi:MFS transporter, ACS family, L-galactonate transporter
VTGWVLDRTGAFDVALSICSGVTFLAALSYLFVVKDPIRDAD